MHQNRRLYMNVTINDIARATGLSTATISKYINHKKIREENRILIERQFRSLDIPQTGMPSFFVPKTHIPSVS